MPCSSPAAESRRTWAATRVTIKSGVIVNSVGTNTIQSSGTNANVYFGPSGSPVDLSLYTEPGSTLIQASSAPFVSNEVMQKLHTGTLILSANNSGLTGGTDYVDQGILTVRNNGALGPSSNNAAAAYGAALDIDGANTTSGGTGITLANRLYLSGGGMLDSYGRYTGAIERLGGTNLISNTVNLQIPRIISPSPLGTSWAWPRATRPSRGW